jgi:hypothetical protein
MPFSSLPKTAFVETDQGPAFDGESYYSPPITYPYSSPSFNSHPDLETGRKTFNWYRVYIGAMALLGLGISALGLALAYFQPASSGQVANQALITGIMYAIFGAFSFAIHAAALFLPPKPYNWIVGIVMIGLGMTSCCLWPFTIPLLIFWVKPETQAYLGRN